MTGTRPLMTKENRIYNLLQQGRQGKEVGINWGFDVPLFEDLEILG